MVDSTEAMIEKIPPQSIQAEQAAIGSMLYDVEATEVGIARLRAEDFYPEGHQLIFRAIRELYLRDRIMPDFVMLQAHMGIERWQQIGGGPYLAECMKQSTTSAAMGHYCDIILDRAKRRAGIRSADAFMLAAYQCSVNFTESIDSYRGQLDNIRETGQPIIRRQLHEHAAQVYYGWEDDNDNEQHDAGLITNLPSLNDILDPPKPGDVIIIAGRPSMGKSVGGEQIALSICEHGLAAGVKRHCLFLSREMSEQSLAMRAITYQSRIPSDMLKNRAYRKTGWTRDVLVDGTQGKYRERITQAIEHFSLYDFELIRPATLRPSDVLAMGRKKKRETGLDFVVIDYLQLLRANDNTNDPYARISAISRELKEAATELGVPFYLVSQLSRAVESRSPKMPMLSDLRESGQIEQDADAVLLLYRPGYYGIGEFNHQSVPRGLVSENDFKSLTQIDVAKQRNGSTGATWVRFDLETSRFFEIDQHHDEGGTYADKY